MSVRIGIKVESNGNAAFVDFIGGPQWELAEILRKAANTVEDWVYTEDGSIRLNDHNGNAAGVIYFWEEED